MGRRGAEADRDLPRRPSWRAHGGSPPRPDEPFAFLRSARGQPQHVAMTPGERHLEIFERLCHTADAVGDLAADAYVAAVAMEQDLEVVSLDRDFARFPDLRWRRPG